MKRGLILNNFILPYTLKQSARAKRLRLAVHPGGHVVVTMPHWFSLHMVETFMQSKADWLLEKIAQLRRIPVLSKFSSRRMYLQYKHKAFLLAWEHIKVLQPLYGIKAAKVTIRNQKTRWGSCSKKGTLSLNYRIVFLNSSQRDYVIAHELSHLIEFNHSPRFWALVTKVAPNYKQIKKGLRLDYHF